MVYSVECRTNVEKCQQSELRAVDSSVYVLLDIYGAIDRRCGYVIQLEQINENQLSW